MTVNKEKILQCISLRSATSEADVVAERKRRKSIKTQLGYL